MSKKPTPQATLTPDAQQEQLLKEAKQMVNTQAFHMKRALDQNNIMEALKHASNMISELRTGLLSPKSYYSLYIMAFDHLRHLEMYIADGGHGRPLHELYELVQYAGNILPRLYLLVTVGSVYIKSMLVPAKEVLYDLVELCRGVQHPTRGLFLRNYLSEMTKDKLPDEGSKYEGTVTDSIDFIIANFTEMNKLWVRLQHLGSELERRKREQEREELNILVGKNLSRLSSLDGLTIGLYKSDVLPRVTQQLISCKDKIAQQYLMVILIQTFPDEFHLRTLDILLDSISKLIDEVDVQPIITSLINRLASYCEANPDTRPSDLNMFEVFSKYIQDMAKERTTLTLPSVISLGTSLINLAVRCFKDQHMTYIDQVYDFVSENIKTRGLDKNPEAIKEMHKVLQCVPNHFKSIRPTLQLKNYKKVLDLLPLNEKRMMAIYLIDNTLANETIIPNHEEVVVILIYISSLFNREEGQTDEEWIDDQTKISYLLSKFYNKDVETMFNILNKAYEQFSGTGSSLNVRYYLVPLIFKTLSIVQTLNKTREENWEKKIAALFKFTNTLVTAVNQADESTLAFNLYIQCTLAAGKCGISKFAYGFFTNGALQIYEDGKLAASKIEFEAVRLMIATINELTCFTKDDYEKISKKLVQLSPKLIQHSDQCRAITICGHLHFSKLDKDEDYNDPKTSLACLKKAVSICSDIHDPVIKSTLLVELLDHYLFFYEKRPEVVDQVYVNGVIQKIKKHFSSEGAQNKPQAVIEHYKNIKEYAESKQKSEIKPKSESNDSVPSLIPRLTKEEAEAQANKWKLIEF